MRYRYLFLQSPLTRSIVVCLAVFLFGCQLPPAQREEAPFYTVPAGSTLILNRQVVIPPSKLKVYIQHGLVGGGANRYHPFCVFELRQARPHPQIVEPDEFEIHRTRPLRSLFVDADAPPLLAGTVLAGSVFQRNGKPTPRVHGIQMFLRSESQPDVYKLVCGHLQDPTIEARNPTLEQIRQTLGDVFTLELAG